MDRLIEALLRFRAMRKREIDRGHSVWANLHNLTIKETWRYNGWLLHETTQGWVVPNYVHEPKPGLSGQVFCELVCMEESLKFSSSFIEDLLTEAP